MRQEIEFIFQDGTKHTIPANNKANFRRIFHDSIKAERVVGSKAVVFNASAQAPANTAKTIIPMEEPVKAPAQTESQVESVTAEAPADEVIIIEEVN